MEIRALLEVIDFTLISSVVDTFSGGSTINRVFKQENNVQVLCNDIDSGVDSYYHLDALQPSTYTKIKKEYGLDAVVISPTFAFLDLALPFTMSLTPFRSSLLDPTSVKVGLVGRRRLLIIPRSRLLLAPFYM